jgi:hypothetical protein
MKALLTLAAVMLMAVPAYAGDNNGPRGGNATAGAKAIGVGVGIAGAQAVNKGSTNVNVNQETERQAPAFGLGGLASGPCTGVSGGFAVSSPLGGGGVYGAKEDEECTKRETARVLYALGMRNEAMAVARTFGPLQALTQARTETVTRMTKKPSGGSDDLGCSVNPDLARSMGIAC